MTPKEFYLLFYKYSEEIEAEIRHQWEQTRQLSYYTYLSTGFERPISYDKFCTAIMPFTWDIKKETVSNEISEDDWARMEKQMQEGKTIKVIEDISELKHIKAG